MNRPSVVAASFAAWTLFGLLSSVQFFFSEGLSGARSYASLALHISIFYWVWAVLTPPLFWFLRSLDARSVARRSTAIAAGALAMVVVHGVVYVAVMHVIDGKPFLGAILDYFPRHTGGDLATYGVLAGIYLLYSATRRARDRDVAASHLAARLAQADLEVLRWQLQPHFLFNALGTVSTLVRKRDHESADRAVMLISRFLRSVLAHRPEAKVTLRDELGMVEAYVAIESIRFRRGISVERLVDEEMQTALVPSALLQPVVENAIHHGLKRTGDVGAVRVVALQKSDELEIQVSNDGEASPDVAQCRAPAGEGFGLRYVRERLAHFYGERASVTLRINEFGSATTIRLPLELGARQLVLLVATLAAVSGPLRAQPVRVMDTAGTGAVLDAVLHDLCGKRVALLTEPSTHGYGWTMAFKGLLVRRLVDECHYDVFMIESGIYDFVNIAKRFESNEPVTDSMVAAAIGGIWSNADVKELIPFLLERAREGRLALAGLDDQLGRGSWAQRELPSELVGALSTADSARCLGVLQKHFSWQYTDAAPFDAGAKAALLGCLASISAAEPTTPRGNARWQMTENLRRSIAQEFPDSAPGGKAANAYAFNLRDQAMFQNFQWWRSRLGAGHKAIVWTATVHGAKELSSVPGYEGFVSMGPAIHRAFGDDAFVLAFSAVGGSYQFVRQPPRTLSPAPDSTLEARLFRDANAAVRYADRVRLRELGTIAARPFGADFKSANWSNVIDGLVVFREERPPRH